MTIILLPVDDPRTIAGLWARACEGITPLEGAFGPEGRHPRPRPQDTYYLAWNEEHLERHACGDGAIGLVYTQAPAPTTRAFGMGLFLEWRGRGLGPALRDAAYALCFSTPDVWKLESEVYSSNAHSLGALHGKHSRARLEGCQRATICIGGTYYDRILFGLTRDEWNAQRGEPEARRI